MSMAKLSTEAYNIITELLAERANNLEPNDKERKEIEIALEEIDGIGTY